MRAEATVFLFDIDGTILLTGGAGRRSFEAAFADVTGRTDACTHFSFAGMTDRAIARTGLLALGREPSDGVIDALIEAYLKRLVAEVHGSASYQVFPHVRETAERLAREPMFAVGLGTGNVRRGAEVKLARGGLGALYGFGGFGCDHEDRAALLEAGAMRGAARLGVPRHACRVVVIGDTTKDVAAAIAIGAESLAVGTGGVDTRALRAAGATWVCRDLAEEGALDMLLRGGRDAAS